MGKHSIYRFIAVTFGVSLPLVSASGQDQQRGSPDTTPVVSLDTGRMLGKWYEIARIDNWFDRDLNYVTSYFSIRPDGLIRIANEGFGKNDSSRLTIGRAKPTDTQGLFRVALNSPFYSDYQVLYISEDYDIVLIGNNTENRLWILARKARISDKEALVLLDEAACRGYDIGRLVWTLQ